MSRAVMSLFVSLVFAQSTYGDHYGAGLAKSTTSASNPLKFYKFLAKYFPVQCQDQAVPTWSIMLIEEHHVYDTAPLSFFSRRTYMAHKNRCSTYPQLVCPFLTAGHTVQHHVQLRNIRRRLPLSRKQPYSLPNSCPASALIMTRPLIIVLQASTLTLILSRSEPRPCRALHKRRMCIRSQHYGSRGLG